MGLPSQMSPILMVMMMTMAILMLLVSPIHAMTLETFLETLYNNITNISTIYIYKIENIKYKVLYYIIVTSKTHETMNSKYNPNTSRPVVFHPPTYQTNPYIPMINVPTTSKLPSPGEIVTSVELLTKHVSDLSRKIDRIESRVNDWVNLQLAERMCIAERGISAIKTCHNDHDEKIARISQHYLTEKDGDDLYERIQDLVDQNDDANKCLDRFSDILTTHARKLRHAKHRSRNLAKKYAEIGILRRRVSKVEENNTENAQCFETTTTELRGIVDEMAVQLGEYKDRCEYLESMGASAYNYNYNYNYNSSIEDLYRDLPSLEPIMCDENSGLCDGTDLDVYFSNYWDNTTKTEEKPEENQKEAKTGEIDEIVVNDNSIMNHIIINVEEELAKYGDVSNDDDEDDEFEKL
jgi:hypothetical protein